VTDALKVRQNIRRKRRHFREGVLDLIDARDHSQSASSAW
jgi:hypothetical protein